MVFAIHCVKVLFRVEKCVCVMNIYAVLIEVLRIQGMYSAGVAQEACRTIWSLASNNDANVTLLGTAGTCKGVVRC